MTTPPDVLKMAREAAVSHLKDRAPDYSALLASGTYDDSDVVQIAIAAIMAERERCAKVAETRFTHGKLKAQQHAYMAGQYIGAAIRNTGGE